MLTLSITDYFAVIVGGVLVAVAVVMREAGRLADENASFVQPMPVVVHLDVMLARRKMRSKELAERIGITEQKVSLLKSGKVKGIRFDTLARICTARNCQPGDILAFVPDPES